MSNFKRERVAELLRSFLAEEVRRLDDPRLLLVTLTAVDISPDLKSAKVYWTVPQLDVVDDATAEAKGPEAFYPPESRMREVEEAFQHAAGHLKRRVGSELRLRYTPQLQFRFDHSVADASRIDYLVRKVSA